MTFKPMENPEIEGRLEQAYITGDLDYFHGPLFVKDLATLGWGLEDLWRDVVTIKDSEGKLKIEKIWPDIKAKMIREFNEAIFK